MVTALTLLLLASAHGSSSQPVEAVRRFRAPRWELVGGIAHPRFSLSAELLPDGRVLAFGGGASAAAALDDAALYDPAARKWRPAAPLLRPRYAVNSAALLDGRVLALGGYPETPGAEVYDPAADAWKPTGPLANGLYRVAVRLKDGRVLAAARSVKGDPTDRAFLYDPKSNAWKPAGDLNEPRSESRAVALSDGRALICGGFNSGGNLSSCEVFDPKTGAWSFAASMSRPRFGFSLSALPDGRVLAAGGQDSAPAELYDPAEDRWTRSRQTVGVRLYHQAALLPDGRVMLVGGYDTRRRLRTTAVYDPATDAWAAGPSLNVGRSDFALRVVEGSKLLAIGGQGESGALSQTEELSAFPQWETLQPLAEDRVEAVEPAAPPEPRPAPRAPELELSGPKRRDGERDFAVIVGVERYRALPTAEFAERDAAAFATAVRGPLGVPEENVIRLAGAAATRTDIAKYVEEWLPRNAEADSRVYFYFSGHGSPDVKSGAAHLVPWDGDPTFLQSTAYPLERLYANLAKLPAREVIVVLDACFSGAGGRSVLAAGTRPLVTKTTLAKPKGGRISILTAAAGDEITGSVTGGAHGLFTYHLLKGLDGAADADADGHVKLSELHGFVKSKVQRAARRQNREQTPQLIAPDPGLPVY